MNLRTAKFRCLSSLAALLFLSSIAINSRSESPACPMEALAAEFKTLRAIRGHFGGDTWNDAADKWDGRKHQVMSQLASCLGTGEFSKSQIIQWMGEPDKIAVKGDFLFNWVESDRQNKLPENSKLLIYYWRGAHDFLYFAYSREIIIDSDWWFAGE